MKIQPNIGKSFLLKSDTVFLLVKKEAGKVVGRFPDLESAKRQLESLTTVDPSMFRRYPRIKGYVFYFYLGNDEYGIIQCSTEDANRIERNRR